MAKLRDLIRRIFDPRGPGGNVLTTESFFKERSGLPYSVGLRQRAELAPLTTEQVAKACAPDRTVAKGEIDVPYSRERVVTPYILERYRPVMQGMEIVGWVVSQEPRSQFCDCLKAHWSKDGGQSVHLACGRRRAPLADAEVIEKVMTVQMQPGDAHYDRYAVTIPGKDTGIVDGQRVTGGTHIRSRKHYNELTRDFVHWDRGTPKAVEKAQREQAENRRAKLARQVEEKAHRLVSDRPGDL
jgi:hypothetical protein